MQSSSTTHDLQLKYDDTDCHYTYLGNDEIQLLLSVLQERSPLTTQPSQLREARGQKRGLDDVPTESNGRSAKRTKRSGSECPIQDEIKVKETREVQVVQHSAEFRCKVPLPDSDNPSPVYLAVEILRQELLRRREILDFNGGESGSQIVQVECGDVVLSQDASKLLIRGQELIHNFPPRLSPSYEDENFEGQGPSLLLAALNLERHQRAATHIALSITSSDLDSTAGFSFSIAVSIGISLILPAIFQPFNYSKRNAQVEESQHTFLSFIFSSVLDRLHPAGKGDVDMPLLFSSIEAAPLLSSQLAEEAAQPEKLLPTLLPFQRRSVGWLLNKEGMAITKEGRVVAKEKPDPPLFWERVQVPGEEPWYFHPITGELFASEVAEDEALGGALAEEPGLGKTVETIALLLLNPAADRNANKTRWDQELQLDIREVKTTLIITPPSLIPQWIDELATHAPHLKVLNYPGWTKVKIPDSTGKLSLIPRDRDQSLEWCSYINSFDVCITTYSIMQRDIYVARAPIYARFRPRSPLVLCEWNRVIMDEVQMVGGGNMEEMVSLIPRRSSLAVSGTPARATVADLIHVLRFLRVNAVFRSPKIWPRLLTPNFAHYFSALFNRITIRTLKSSVKDELTIPQQTRYVVPIELGRVERLVYDRTLEDALLQLGLDARGVAASENWQLDIPTLRFWLRRLRGICIHPQIGQQGGNERRPKYSAPKTILEVLEQMRDQNWRDLTDYRKGKIQAIIRHGRLTQLDDKDPRRYRNAINILQVAKQEVRDLCDAVGHLISQVEETITHLKDEARKKWRLNHNTEADDFDDISDEIYKTTPIESQGSNLRSLKSRLREYRMLEHKILFTFGDLYHALGPAHASSEDEAYEAADAIRKELLSGKFFEHPSFRCLTEESAKQSIDALNRSSTKKLLQLKDLYLDYSGKGGIKSDNLLREADELVDILNGQTELLLEWREKLEELLTAPLSANRGDSADGEEYARTLDMQGKAEIYLQAYAALAADRRELLTSERTALAAYDVRETKTRKTNAAIKAAAALDKAVDWEPLTKREIELEFQVLHTELESQRKGLFKNYHNRAIKSIQVDLSNVATQIDKDTNPEKIIAKDKAQYFRLMIQKQGELHAKIDNDLAMFRGAFNDRVQYFRQLQDLSDTVTEEEWEGNLQDAINSTKIQIEETEENIRRHQARHRYLQNLAKAQAEGQTDEEDDACILCRCDFNRGFITECAHLFCETCMKAWLAKREGGKACPVCRMPINVDKMQRISISGKEREVDVEVPRDLALNDVPVSHRDFKYNKIDEELLETIRDVQSEGSYGSKIDTLIKHLLFLRENDPGTKSIVFSAWSDSLHIIQHALTANGIGHLMIDQRGSRKPVAKEFRTNQNISVLLLHGERENAGLNVTCASRVFLVESVVNQAFEKQAIARIDRMGQTRPTEVFCYYAEETVEKSILDFAARNGTSIYIRENSTGTLAAGIQATKTEIEGKARMKPAQKKGDIINKAEDMLAILFPHLFEDLEYLIPEMGEGKQLMNYGLRASQISSPNRAGPSRLAN